jgi:hypothetical protein
MPPVGFEATISAGERQQAYALTARPLGPAASILTADNKSGKMQAKVSPTLLPSINYFHDKVYGTSKRAECQNYTGCSTEK